ncbi:hypothetical protein NDU88_001141 [Pleurodeles waltl]|uniref:Uncharacterized protein n=1 Tax=Pleurodeles waltl TaxID=8319 RepID=A0AAV7Q563_PLEWA|nr:hypothetical protein NDU88_001141 [Pleurodeles waltl]
MIEKPINANVAEVNMTSVVEDEYDLTSQVETLSVRNTQSKDRIKGKATKDLRDNYKTKCYRCGYANEIQGNDVDVGCIKMPECQVTIDGKEVTVLAVSGSPLVGAKNWERIFGKLDIHLRKPDIDPGG